MWIQELNIQNFGKFQNRKITFGPGINLIYGENESGKSTLHAFLRGCFYGVKKSRGRASKTDVYSRYRPWEVPGYFAGSMRFVCGDKVFRISRDFTKGIQAGELVCESDGELLSLEDGDLEMLLGNVNEIVFDNTVSIGQLRSETDEGLAKELKNHMANLEGTGHASIKVEHAISLLKDKKKQLQKELTEYRQQENYKKNQLLTRLTFLKEEKEKDQQEMEKVKKQYESIRLDLDNKSERKMKSKGFLARFIDKIKGFFRKLFRKNKNEEVVTGQEQRLEGKIEQLEQQIHEKEILIENGLEDIQLMEVLFVDEKSKLLNKEIEGCELAMKRIQEVVSQMQMDVGQFLKKRTSEIFYQLTNGRYQFVELKEDLTMLVHSKDHVVQVEQLSRGTIWQLYFALRMAANEVLCQEENLPVILDDAFVMYDDARLENVLAWLSKQKKQILIFTCQKREKDILSHMGTPFQTIYLS